MHAGHVVAVQRLSDGAPQVPGRIWDGKDAVLAALAAVTKSCGSALSVSDGARVVAALTEAVGRKKSDFRQAALAALETVLTALSGQDHYAAAAPPLLATIKQHRELAASEAVTVRFSWCICLTRAALGTRSCCRSRGGHDCSGPNEAVLPD